MATKKRKIGNCSEEIMREAVSLVMNGGSLRKVAASKDIAFQTLARYVTKAKHSEDADAIRMAPNYSVKKIFTIAEEASLEKYIIDCSRMFYGLSVTDCRKLAYEMAVDNKKNIPGKWHDNKMAGLKWFRCFRASHNQLSLRTPEGCSLSRATSFNRHNVSVFYENLKAIYSRSHHFADGRRIFNLDETGTVTVQKPQKVVAVWGVKQVNKVTSGERGTLVTTCCIINATGQYLPPAMVFPRTHFKEHVLRGAPPGTLGLAAPTGWMNAELFIQVMKHFIKYSNSSIENPSLLIYDNHESHLSIAVLNLAKTNGVTILTVPPHSTNKIQPLDVGVYKPFSTAYNAAIDSWMMQHPGKPLSIYEVAECVGIAHEKALTPSNIIHAFKKCGIYPFDANVFTDVDFLPSAVTDRVLPKENENEGSEIPFPSTSSLVDATPQNNKYVTGDADDKHDDTIFFKTPEEFRGFPKAEPRRLKNTRRRGKSIIATDTPEKNAIEERSMERKNKLSMKGKEHEKISLKVQKIKRKVFEEDSESSEEEPILDSSSGDECFVKIDPGDFQDLHRSPFKDDFVLVEFTGKTEKTKIYFIGKVLAKVESSEEYEITFLRNQRGTNKYVYPEIIDESVVPITDIKLIMPDPIPCGHTSRQKASFTFEIDLSLLNIR